MSEGPVRRPSVPIPDQPIATYELTTEGIKEVSGSRDSLTIVPSHPRQWRRFFLLFLLAVALVNYGIDAPVVRNFLEAQFDSGSMKMGLEPYRLWARAHPLSYDEVVVDPGIFEGKAAVWTIGIDEHGNFFEGAFSGKKVYIVKVMESVGVFPEDGGIPIAVLVRIEGAKEEYPLVTILERAQRGKND